MQEHVLNEIDTGGLAIYAVWEPILRTDNEQAARKATMLFSDERVLDFWAPTREVGEAFQAPIHLTTEPAWDVYLIYEAGVEWSEGAPPAPGYFMHQLGGRLPDDRRLDGPALRKAIESALDRQRP